MLNPQEFEKYRALFGYRADQSIEILLNGIEHLREILASELHRVVIVKDLQRESDLMNKAYQENLTDDERIELKYINKRLAEISNEFARIAKKENEIKKQLDSVN
jgi:hypothetical protein